jgi:predicted nucleic acid-binding protein
MATLVLIDTCIWVPFFSRKASLHKAAVGELLDDDRATIIGPILSEILVGIRKQEEADWVASALEGAQYLDLAWDDWRAAASLGRQLSSGGISLPLSDLCLASTALRSQALLYSIDPHFDRIPGLKRYEPGGL